MMETNESESMAIKNHIQSIINVMSEGIYEKQHILAMALLSTIAGESIFLLGPPGTAKSLIARRLKLAFKDGKAFEYLMSRFSTPDEIFGPVSISLLKNEDRYERVVDGFLPTATIVFLDEIWKASPSIQNALLTAINERIFQNGRTTLSLPMKVLIAASNELPVEDEGLEALWDRFLVRMVSNCIQNESAFLKMIRQKPIRNITMPTDLQITDELYQSWQDEIENIHIPNDVCDAVSFIRKRLKEEIKKAEHNAMDFYVSDRRWKKCFHLLQTSAFLNGRQSINLTDIPILIHCLWNTADSIPIVIDIVVSSLADNIDRQMEKLAKDIDQAIKQMSHLSTPQDKKEKAHKSAETFKLFNYFYYDIQNYPSGKCVFYRADYNHIRADRDCDGIIYWDEQKKLWIVHAIYTGAPFDYKINQAEKVHKVTLRKCNGGIIIDGTPYGFERMASAISAQLREQTAPTLNAADIALALLTNELIPAWTHLQKSFAEANHLFLSDEDRKIVKKHLAKCEKRIKELEVKIRNAQQLL